MTGDWQIPLSVVNQLVWRSGGSRPLSTPTLKILYTRFAYELPARLIAYAALFGKGLYRIAQVPYTSIRSQHIRPMQETFFFSNFQRHHICKPLPRVCWTDQCVRLVSLDCSIPYQPRQMRRNSDITCALRACCHHQSGKLWRMSHERKKKTKRNWIGMEWGWIELKGTRQLYAHRRSSV